MHQAAKEVPVADPFVETVLSTVASVKHMARERITLESSLQDLGFDSLDAIVLTFELEKQFNISIPDDKVRSVRSVRDIVEEVARLAGNGALDPVRREDG
jgi:acyl carrier protein